MIKHKFVFSEGSDDQSAKRHEVLLDKLSADGWTVISFSVLESGCIATMLTRHVSAPRDLGARR